MSAVVRPRPLGRPHEGRFDLGVTGTRYDPNVALEPELEQHRGEWVAHDEEARRVLAAADTAEALYEILDSSDHPLVTIRRIPRLDEPIFIGLG